MTNCLIYSYYLHSSIDIPENIFPNLLFTEFTIFYKINVYKAKLFIRYAKTMSEAVSNEEPRNIREIPPVLRSKEQLAKIKKINGVTITGSHDGATSGHILFGHTTAEGKPRVIKIAKNPEEDTGVPYEHNARMLQQASLRTLFVPIYYGHNATEVPDEEGNFPFIAMERIKGKTLKEVMKTYDIQQSLDILRAIARGADELLEDKKRGVHEMTEGEARGNDQAQTDSRAIIPTDIKPSNIMIREKNGRPVLLDFDSAKYEGEPTLSFGKQELSPMYSGPDLIQQNSPIRRELNTWQLAAIAFEMLTHEPLMNIENILGLVYKYSSEDVYNEFLDQRLKIVGLPSATRDVLAKALSFNPGDRYDSSIKFTTALDEAESRYINRSRRKDEGHTLTKPVKNIAHRLRGPGEIQQSHDHFDTSRPGRYRGKHKQSGRHRVMPKATGSKKI